MNKLIGFLYIIAMAILFIASMMQAYHNHYPKATYFMVCFGLMAWWLNKALEGKNG